LIVPASNEVGTFLLAANGTGYSHEYSTTKHRQSAPKPPVLRPRVAHSSLEHLTLYVRKRAHWS
jgi:hypothetical protein